MLLYVNKKQERLKKIKISLIILACLLIIIANFYHLKQALHESSSSLNNYTSIKQTVSWYKDNAPIIVYQTTQKQIKAILIPENITKQSAPAIAKSLLKTKSHPSSCLYFSKELQNNNFLQTLKEVLDLQTSTTASACVIVSSNFDKIKPIIKEQKLRPLSLSKQTLKHSAFNTLLEKTFPTPKLPSNKLDQEQLALQRFAKDHQQTIQKLFSSPYVFDFPFSEQNTILKNANLCLKTKSNIYCSLDSKLSFIQNLINAKNKLPKNSTIQKLILLTSFQPLNSTTLPKDSGLFFTFQSRNAILLPFEITSNPIQTIKQKAGINPAHSNNLMQFYQFKTVEIDIK